MNRIRPYINRFVKQKQLEITDVYHDQNLKEIRPLTTKLMQHSEIYTINNSKREMIREVRDFQIERENKLLLHKIESVMTKKGSYSVSRTKSMNTKTNKSLNEIYRKKQMQSIELENKRFLMRLQGKRPTVNTLKLRRDWEDNKSVIKRMANCEFNMTQFKSKDSRIRSMTSERLFRQKFDDAKISKFRVIDGHKMLIKIEFSDGYLKIVGDSRDHKDLKVIEIPKEEAVLFIEKDCQGRLEKILDKLKYDESTETLYLVSENIEEESLSELNPEGGKAISKSANEKYQRGNKSTLEHLPSGKPDEEISLHQTISHPMSENPLHPSTIAR